MKSLHDMPYWARAAIALLIGLIVAFAVLLFLPDAVSLRR
jgi:uncharacterized membrane-anchored protein YhcB (DUF1043 family)